MNSVLLPTELYVALIRFLRYEEDQAQRNQRNRSYPYRESESDDNSEEAVCPHNYLKMRRTSPQEKPEQSKRIASPTVLPEVVPVNAQQYGIDFFNSRTNSQGIVRTPVEHRSRSSSAPASSATHRECQRGADKFCPPGTPQEHNYLGLQPSEIYRSRSNQGQHMPTGSSTPTRASVGRDCSQCANRPPTDSYGVPGRGVNYDNRSLDPNYEQWLLLQKQQQQQQQQQQLQQQQQMQQQQNRAPRQHHQQQQQQQQQPQQPGPSCCGYQRANDQMTYDNFKPGLNSTMVGNRQPCELASCTPIRPQQQPSPQQQQQQQLQPKPQLPPVQQRSLSCCRNGAPQEQTANTVYPARTLAQRLPSQPGPDSYGCQARQTAPCQQCDQPGNFDNSTFMQSQPQPQPQRTSCLRPPPQPANVTFSDQYRAQPQPANVSVPNDSWPSTSQNASYTPGTPPPQPQRAGPTNKPSTIRVTPFCDSVSAEERYIQRTHTLFFNALVMDQSCPGIIQNTLNGRDDFNDYAFDIAFAGNVPDKPFPIDPITMLEAIKLRIDYEREEIRKKCPLNDGVGGEGREDSVSEISKDDSRKTKDNKQRYYCGKDSKKQKAHSDKWKSGAGRRSRISPETDDIDRHFYAKNRSEVNDGVHAFLKAETAYNYGIQHQTPETSRFSADVNSHDSNFFGLPIKMKVYNGTTWPIE